MCIRDRSAPEARALGNISGFRPGVKIKLRLTFILFKSIKLLYPIILVDMILYFQMNKNEQ